MGVAGNHDIDRAVEFLDDVDDRPRYPRAFIVVAGRIAAFVDQHDDGLDAACLQFRDQRIYGVRLVLEFEAREPDGRNDVGRALQGQADEGNGNPIEFPDCVSWKYRLAGILLDGGGREVMELRAEEGMRPLALVHGMAAAILHPLQFVLALIEFVVADRGNVEPHHRQRFDRRFVVEHRRQKWAGADQVSGRDKDRVLVVLAQLLDQRRHVLGAAGRHRDLFGLVVGIGNPDAAGGGTKVPWKSLIAKILKSTDAACAMAREAGSERNASASQRQRQMKSGYLMTLYNKAASTTISRSALNPSCATRTP